MDRSWTKSCICFDRLPSLCAAVLSVRRGFCQLCRTPALLGTWTPTYAERRHVGARDANGPLRGRMQFVFRNVLQNLFSIIRKRGQTGQSSSAAAMSAHAPFPKWPWCLSAGTSPPSRNLVSGQFRERQFSAGSPVGVLAHLQGENLRCSLAADALPLRAAGTPTRNLIVQTAIPNIFNPARLGVIINKQWVL